MLVLIGFTAVLLPVIYWYYRRNKPELPKLHYVECPLTTHIIERKSRFTSLYIVPFWLQNTHVQTLLGFLKRSQKIQFSRKYIKMKDGGVIALDWAKDNMDDLTERSPILFVLLMWTAMRERASGLCKEAMCRGFRVVVFNKRGHGLSGLATPKLQSLADYSDISECVELIRRKYPQTHVVAHASSAGCAPLISYLAGLKSSCPLTAAAFVCPSYNVSRTFREMPFIYKQFLINAVKVVLWTNRKVLSSAMNLTSAFLSFRMKTLNMHTLCKAYGYQDVEKFHKEHDPLLNIEAVAIPCLAISSGDDPICRLNTCPYHLFKDEEKGGRMLVTTSKGGHCGFFQRDMGSWSEQLSMDYLEAVVEFRQSNDHNGVTLPCRS